MNRLERFLSTAFLSVTAAVVTAGCATFPTPATREVTINNVTRKQDIPLCERDIIALRQPNLFGVRAVNLNYVLRTGEIPMSDFAIYNDSIDWDKDDAFTRALKTIEQNALGKIRDSTELQALLAKPCWDKADREGWEEGVCRIVGEEMWAIPGLDKYRTHTKLIGHALNKLSDDIEHNTHNQEFDCKGTSFVRGCVLQRIENRLLPSGGPPDAFKKAMGYFVIAGGVCFGDDSKTGGHTFTFTPAGNVIEGTETPGKGSGYKRAAQPMGFEDFVRGRPLVTTQNDVYGGYLTDGGRARADSGKAEKRWTRTELLARMNAQDCGNGFITLASRSEKDGRVNYSLELYQKRDAGSPLEAWECVARDSRDCRPGDKPPHMTLRYHDDLKNKDYKFGHDFAGDAAPRRAQSFGFFAPAPVF